MIKIAYFTNFLFHHQYPLCREMLKQKDVDFTFICCEPLSEERKSMGYDDLSNLPFVIRSYESKESHDAAMELAKSADVAIFGSTDLEFLYARMSLDKLTFRYCERALRKGAWRAIIPQTARAIYKQYLRYRKKNLYIMSASAYTSHDLGLFGFDIRKCFKWGYLPDVMRYDDFESMVAAKSPRSILWVGRFIECKHPEFAIEAAKQLTERGIDYSLKFIGDGPLRPRCEDMVKRFGLSDKVTFSASVKPDEVRHQMDKASIFIFTSDRYEGWGAVVGEAMNSGCAVLVSHACGSAPYLIEQNSNGRVYEYGNLNEFVGSLSDYLSDTNIVNRLGLNACETMQSLWNVETAVPRLVEICKALLNHSHFPDFVNGPCSVAFDCKNNWYKEP